MSRECFLSPHSQIVDNYNEPHKGDCDNYMDELIEIGNCQKRCRSQCGCIKMTRRYLFSGSGNMANYKISYMILEEQSLGNNW